MRKVYLIEFGPPTPEDFAEAHALGAAEIIVGIPEALADIGITTYGFHEVPQNEEPRRTLPKSVVQDRLYTAGKFDAAWALVTSDPYMFARWVAPNHPNVYADDSDLLAVLAQVGADIEETTAPV